jgi:anti-sigma regulatory factor (Ser/Thr protein kinase)
MLPGALPQLPGFSLAARYAPSGQGAAAGGDFYDAFELPDGRLALVIGDVVGHGVRAATVMGQVRAAVRVLTVREGEPVAVLGGLDDFVASVGEECFVTMLLALVDPVSRTVQLACAGHLPPLLCRNVPGSAESAPVAVTPGAPVGLGGERTAMEFALDVDDVLVLYTDGLVEVPGEDLEAAIEALAADVSGAAASGDPRRIGSDLVDKRRTHDDDAAVLVLVVSERRHRVASVELPPEARSAAAARSWARGVLEAWSANEDVVDSAVLGISELVSNSVLHAQSTVRVELDLDDRCLLVLVTDAGGHSSPSPQDVEPTSSRGRGLAVVRAIATAWGNEQSSRGSTVWFELARSG